MDTCAMYYQKKIFGNCVKYLIGMISNGDDGND